MVQKTPPAQLNITDGSVTLPPNCVVFEGPDNSAFQFVHVNNIRDLTFYYRDEIPSGTNIRETAFEFDRFICAEQSILKAISQPGGPWASEIPKKKLFRAAITLEGYLNITLEYMNELADLVEDLRTGNLIKLAEMRCQHTARCDQPGYQHSTISAPRST